MVWFICGCFLFLWAAGLFDGMGSERNQQPYVPPEPPTRHWLDGYNYNPGPGPYGGQSK